MKKTIISFCLIAFAVTTFISCKKETAQPSNSLNAVAVSNIGKTKYTGSSTIGDTTKTKANP